MQNESSDQPIIPSYRHLQFFLHLVQELHVSHPEAFLIHSNLRQESFVDESAYERLWDVFSAQSIVSWVPMFREKPSEAQLQATLATLRIALPKRFQESPGQKTLLKTLAKNPRMRIRDAIKVADFIPKTEKEWGRNWRVVLLTQLGLKRGVARHVAGLFPEELFIGEESRETLQTLFGHIGHKAVLSFLSLSDLPRAAKLLDALIRIHKYLYCPKDCPFGGGNSLYRGGKGLSRVGVRGAPVARIRT